MIGLKINLNLSMSTKEIIRKDMQSHKPIAFAIESILFPFVSWLSSIILLFYLHKAGEQMGLGALALVPYTLFALGGVIVGFSLGIISGGIALILAKELTLDKKRIVHICASFGLILSLFEVLYFVRIIN